MMSNVSFRPALDLRNREFRGLGGWKGKPLHPPLAAVPIGAAVAVTIFDVVSVLVPSDETLGRELYRAGTFTLIAGQAFVALAVLTGWWDRRRLRRGSEPRKVANAHGWTMLAMGAAAFGDIVIRRGVYPSAPHTPAAVLGLTLTVMALTIVGGTLGGELVFHSAVGVETDEDHTAVDQRADHPLGGVSSDALDAEIS
jgi:uncharacterized membrane protein